MAGLGGRQPPPETGLCCTAVAPLAVAVLDEYNSTLAHGAGAGAAITIRLPSQVLESSYSPIRTLCAANRQVLSISGTS